MTEVYHVNGEGKDGGVVYCEMQSNENSGDNLAWNEYSKEMYPNCGYSAVIGGLMHNLRTQTTNENVRAFHSKYYRSENITVIVTGQIKIDDIAKAVEPVEKLILSKPKKDSFDRPWHKPIEPLTKSVDKSILYPSDTEDNGYVWIGVRGPNCSTDFETLEALSMLLSYLSDTSISPLQRDMVEIENPYASYVGSCWDTFFESNISLIFCNVPVGKIDSVKDKTLEVLTQILNGNEKIDMKRMRTVIEQTIIQFYRDLECVTDGDLTQALILDSLYGNTNEDVRSFQFLIIKLFCD